MRKTTAGAAAAGLGAAAAVVALVAGTSTGTAASAASEAFAITAAGLVDVDKTPHVSSSDGKPREDSLANVPLGENGEVRVMTLAAGDNTASVEMAGVDLGAEFGSLSARVLEVACEGGTGTVKLAGLNLNGMPVDIPPAEQNPVNEEITVPGAATITYNKQTSNADGSFTVVGLEVDLLDSTQTVTLGSATCAAAGDDGDDPGDGDGDTPSAPAPAPITTGLPVTG